MHPAKKQKQKQKWQGSGCQTFIRCLGERSFYPSESPFVYYKDLEMSHSGNLFVILSLSSFGSSIRSKNLQSPMVQGPSFSLKSIGWSISPSLRPGSFDGSPISESPEMQVSHWFEENHSNEVGGITSTKGEAAGFLFLTFLLDCYTSLQLPID